MPWIIISANGDELERRELSDPLVIGRSPECDVAVRDILLSRTHCRLEPNGHGWKLIDLNSKNGTRVGWQDVQTHVLRDGDHLRMGRTRIAYHTGPFEPAPSRPSRPNRIIRPADPHEALSGTVTDFVLIDDEESGHAEVLGCDDRPFPQPRPVDPVSDIEPATQSLLDDVAASFWSLESGPPAGVSVAAAESTALARPRTIVRALPRIPAKPVYRQIRRPAADDTDLSLQADARLFSAPASPAAQTTRQRLLRVAGLTVAAAIGTGIVVMSLWLLTLAP